MDEVRNHDIGVVIAALSTGGETVKVLVDASEFSGIHVLPGQTTKFDATVTFWVSAPDAPMVVAS